MTTMRRMFSTASLLFFLSTPSLAQTTAETTAPPSAPVAPAETAPTVNGSEGAPPSEVAQTPSAAPEPSPSAGAQASPESAPEAEATSTNVTQAPESATAQAPQADEKSEQALVKAEFGKGILIGTHDEKFTVNLRGRMQLLASVLDPNGSANTVTQVQVRRLRLVLQGNAWGPDLTYYFQLAFSNRDTEADQRLAVRDAYFTYSRLRDLNLRIGQMKVPYGRQRITSSSALGMVDRSVVVAELNLDRDVGIHAFSKDLFGLGERLGYSLAVFGGDGRNRLAKNAGYLFAGRLNFTPLGGFDDNVEADIKRESKPRLAFGVSAAYNQQTNRPQSTIGEPYPDSSVYFNYAHVGADFMFKWRGFFATGEWMLRHANERTQSGIDENGDPVDYFSRESWGAFGQLGQMLTDSLEITARYGHIQPLSNTDPDLSLTQELGGGLSYYFHQHNLKVQGDYFYLSENADFSAGDHQGRVQAQLFF